MWIGDASEEARPICGGDPAGMINFRAGFAPFVPMARIPPVLGYALSQVDKTATIANARAIPNPLKTLADLDEVEFNLPESWGGIQEQSVVQMEDIFPRLELDRLKSVIYFCCRVCLG